MNLEVTELSIQFYHYVDDIVGSEEVVKTRRRIFIALDNVMESANSTCISSGSKAEGLDLIGSDYDQMCVCKDVGVYETLHDADLSHGVTLLMETTDTKPGFTKLRAINPSDAYVSLRNKRYETVERPIFLSSKLFLESFLQSQQNVQTNVNIKIHGPCVSPSDESYDVAHCFRSKKWIGPAKQWISRSCTWPDHALTQSIVQYGVLFVPIGCKGSVCEDLEWRISFSVAERQLIFSFSHTQLLCYALMKILLKDIIRHKHDDLICSYFLKIIMFWLCEESAAHQWTPEMYVKCFMSCLQRLIYCVEYKTCLHYFIPDYNLFEGRFLFEQHKTLLDALYKIYQSPLNFIFHSATFENYRKAHKNSFSSNLRASSLTCLKYTYMFFPNVQSSISFEQILIRMANQPEKNIATHLLSITALRLIPDVLNLRERNKSSYKQYQIMLRYFKTGVYSSSVEAWALLASLFYKCGRYRECIQILNYSLSKCTSDNILISLNNDIVEQSIFQDLEQTVGLLLACKHFILCEVIMIEPYNLLPRELAPLIKEKIYRVIMFPPVVYMHVLQYFCLHHLGDNSGKVVALRDIKLTIRERYHIRENEYYLTLANKCLSIAKSMI